MRNAGLEEAQAVIKIAGRNINNLRYADDTILMAESEEELKSLLMKGKEETEKVGLKLSIQKAKIMSSDLIISWQIDGETVETVRDLRSLKDRMRLCWHLTLFCLQNALPFSISPKSWGLLAFSYNDNNCCPQRF